LHSLQTIIAIAEKVDSYEENDCFLFAFLGMFSINACTDKEGIPDTREYSPFEYEHKEEESQEIVPFYPEDNYHDYDDNEYYDDDY